MTNLGTCLETVGEFDRWQSPRVALTRERPQQSSAQESGYAIKRIEAASHELKGPFIFDLHDEMADASRNGNVRMIAFYNMAEDDVYEEEKEEEEELSLEVRIVRKAEEEWFDASEDSYDIVIDSGADATSYIHAGIPLDHEAPKLQDTQGEAIKIKQGLQECELLFLH